MTSVEQLTAVVEGQSGAFRPSEHTGVSDHIPHIQKVTLKTDDKVTEFVLGTFNVLAQKFMWYQNGRKPDGSPLPDWYKRENMSGLWDCPLADESLAEQRQAAIVSIIVRIFEDNSALPVVLCLQECEFAIVDEVRRTLKNLTVQFDSLGTPGKVTMSRNAGAIGPADYNTRVIMGTLIEPGDFGRNIIIANSHLSFKSTDNENAFQELKAYAKHRPLFVAGDYNIQCMPISEKAKNEGSTKTLTEFVNEVVCGKIGWKYALAEHELGYTNFNCRMNCIDPAVSADHFDNILFLHTGDYEVEFSPISAPKEGEWWKQ